MRNRRILSPGIIAGKIYTVPEVAGILRISPGTLYNKLWKGDQLPRNFRVGNKVRFQGKAIQEFIDEQQG